MPRMEPQYSADARYAPAMIGAPPSYASGFHPAARLYGNPVNPTAYEHYAAPTSSSGPAFGVHAPVDFQENNVKPL